MNDDEIDVFARTLYGEARKEGLLGIEAVANVILNRVQISKIAPVYWGRTITEVCLKPLQFQCWNPGNDNFCKILHVDDTDPVFHLCRHVAFRSKHGFLTDITHGATHYHDKQENPAWARKLIPVYEYKNHLFYREIA